MIVFVLGVGEGCNLKNNLMAVSLMRVEYRTLF